MIPEVVTINKNKKSIQFDYLNNTHLILKTSYLRACSPSAENKNRHKSFDIDKKTEMYSDVLIHKVEAVGNYALRIIFDDGHNTGIFSWEYIYKLGSRFQSS